MHIINIREYPRQLEIAADYFSSKWVVPRELYHESMLDSLTTEKPVPRWYLMLENNTIIGCFGLIENDFMIRTDLCPWLCALYVEPDYRCRGLGGQMLFFARVEAQNLGFETLYLNTDHIGYYEKYNWQFLGEFPHQSGDDTRVYKASSISVPEPMACFFDKRAEEYEHHMIHDLQLADFYSAVSSCFEKPVRKLLDLGCGTGLELEGLYNRFPQMQVTGIDVSVKMLDLLKNKFSGKPIHCICGSYFEVDFNGRYDHIVSTYSLHHFTVSEKLKLYRKIAAALEPNGCFIWGDYTVQSVAEQDKLLADYTLLHQYKPVEKGQWMHFDIPLTAETETKLLLEAGFKNIEMINQWKNTTLMIATK